MSGDDININVKLTIAIHVDVSPKYVWIAIPVDVSPPYMWIAIHVNVSPLYMWIAIHVDVPPPCVWINQLYCGQHQYVSSYIYNTCG